MSHEPKIYFDTIGKDTELLNKKVKSLHSKMFIENNFEESKALENPLAMNLYKILRARNATIMKYRQEYQHSILSYTRKTSIFDNKSDDSISDEMDKSSNENRVSEDDTLSNEEVQNQK
mmetsp:Transcript_16705/g.14619  ORF Transcript_16705/g.14619 Transcript_16705/m.14619 type:complete len:119 (-) Transcript_16705:129-485(-)|eukprot:CAMPEP_0205800476 /NCGR_PEP_ID=MMETSP0205-20121125/2133_1 /ASSEMBLY_ACC=CAM_ASM_000278 /TAXON_ID=36767 /ORGANISM="Euplotes focardii, Strain TN1" /LENGTH=118 /DNA_ID=CAMNT_0053063599 /DNA_START=656 /DNA_END=1012 /DNA_ORIENTATION=-